MDFKIEDFEYIFNIVCPIFLLAFGLIGDLLGSYIFFISDSLSSIGPMIIYRSLFINDLLTIVQIVCYFLSYSLYIPVFSASSITCKLLNFLIYSIPAISPIFLVYISIERFISIGYPTKRKYLQNKRNQLIFVLVVCSYNFIYYIPTITGMDLMVYSANDSLVCNYKTYEYQTLLSYMDLINRVFLPFLLMTIFSIALIIIIFKSRIRILASGSISEKKTFKKDVKFSISILIFNFIFLLCNLPLSLFLLYPDYLEFPFLYILLCWLLFVSYTINFYVLIFTNSVFRKEALSIFNFNKILTSQSQD